MQSQMSNCLGEKNESLGIVRVVNSLLLVKAGSLVKFRRVHKANGIAGRAFERPDAAGDAPRAQRQLQIHASRFHLWKPLAHSRVQGRDHADLVTSTRQCFAQGADHVGQTTGF